MGQYPYPGYSATATAARDVPPGQSWGLHRSPLDGRGHLRWDGTNSLTSSPCRTPSPKLTSEVASRNFAEGSTPAVW